MGIHGGTAAPPNQELADLFAVLDADGSGELRLKELVDVLEHNQEAMELAKRYQTLHQFVELSSGRKKKKKRKMSKARKQSIHRARSAKQLGGHGDKKKHSHRHHKRLEKI